MINDFKESINNLYNIILQPIDNIYKNIAINNHKNNFEISSQEKLGDFYYRTCGSSKSKGVVYTPIEIARYIIENTISAEDIINNPYIKILDPACGCGNIIIECFKYLQELFNQNIDKINDRNNLKLKLNQIDEHIVKNNLYGFDVDTIAIRILTIDLFNISGVYSNNFFNRDFLLEDSINLFDIVIANPPYIGHKSMEREYSYIIKSKFKEIYKDKGDLSYCFFQKSIDNMPKSGKLSFITSRYFLEAPSGEQLRKVLKDICSIYKIIDFYGIRPFKNVGVDPVIIMLTKNQDINSEIEVIKPLVVKGKNSKDFYESVFLNQGKEFNKFNINKNLLNNKGWILREHKERKIINKIENKSFTNLSNICLSHQGMITGCDKAFVVTQRTIEQEKIEDILIKPWIKSSFIDKCSVSRKDSYIIYSDLIKDENQYPNAIKYISKYKQKLSKRRECERQSRKWYELQWGRNQDIFESKKIIFPYKASSNRFAIDKGSYFSADVYCLILKKEEPFSYEYLQFLLNSKIYEFYFKTFAKKLGENLYEYYPNNIMKICIPTMMNIEHYNDEDLYKFFELDEEEIDIVKKSVQ